MEWKTVKLGDLVSRKIGYGIVQPGASPSIGVPIIKANNIISGLSDVSLLDKTTAEIAAQYSRTKLKGGELVISLVGSVGKTSIVPPSFAGANLVRATGLIDIESSSLALWVKYYIDSPDGQYYINSNLNTTVQATLNIKDLVEMPIPMPDIEVRDHIVNILSSLDAQIENNNRINRNLEEQAQALFKSWFVDFEPWDGKMPEEWKEYELGEFMPIKTGKKDANVAGKVGTYPFFSCSQDILWTDIFSFEGSAILVAGNGANVGMSILYDGKFEVYQRTYVLQSFSASSLFLPYIKLALDWNWKQYNDDKLFGSAIPYIKLSNLQNYIFPLPPLAEQRRIVAKIEELFAEIDKLK